MHRINGLMLNAIKVIKSLEGSVRGASGAFYFIAASLSSSV